LFLASANCLAKITSHFWDQVQKGASQPFQKWLYRALLYTIQKSEAKSILDWLAAGSVAINTVTILDYDGNLQSYFNILSQRA